MKFAMFIMAGGFFIACSKPVTFPPKDKLTSKPVHFIIDARSDYSGEQYNNSTAYVRIRAKKRNIKTEEETPLWDTVIAKRVLRHFPYQTDIFKVKKVFPIDDELETASVTYTIQYLQDEVPLNNFTQMTSLPKGNELRVVRIRI